MRLEYKTPGMGDPRGKPKVWFSCHPLDAEKAREDLTDDILKYANCAVWYDAEPEAPYDPAELKEILGGMQLLAFGVTERFLRESCRAREVELPFALEQHIPVLPILTETGLEWDFNKICAEVQLVNRHVSDPTATPYEDVLKTFLNSVLVGDDLAGKVRDAFDAYVFLSYRKKDRRHAQRLMHLIHDNPQFRDIAIWYDEYLVPGEDFNDAIRAAFNKSGLFALAVTPHLLEPGNYVMETEFPLARERKNEKKDLEIVPVEMYEEDREENRTDREALKDSYRGIPKVEDEHKRPELDAALVEALKRISIKENDASARHRFFIGLAYLCGIDVEVNYGRALEMIVSAAEDPEPCTDATEKLVDMYWIGEGVARNPRTALEWQKRLVQQYRAEYGKHPSPDEHKGFGTKTFKALMTLSDMQRELGDRDDAMHTAEEALRLGKELKDEVGVREVDRDRAVMCNRIGGLYRDRGDLRQAMEYYRQALEIYERLAREIGTARARRDLSVSLERIGDVYRKQKDPEHAAQMYSRAQEIREVLAEDLRNRHARRDLSAILVKQGNLRKTAGDLDDALDCYRKALEIDRVLAAEEKTDQARDDYAVGLLKAGDVLRKKGGYRGAAEYQKEAVEIFSDIAEGTGSLRSRRSLATALEKLAKALENDGRQDAAERCLERALRLRKEIAAELPSDDARHELAVTSFQYAEFHRDAAVMQEALEIWEELGSRRPEYRKYAEEARKRITQSS